MKTFNLWVIGESFWWIFSLLDKCYFRIMKLLNFMNCPVSEASATWASRKLHGPFFLIETPAYLLLIKNSSSVTKKSPIACIKETECGMNVRIKLKFFKEVMSKFTIKNKASTLFVENHLHKKISQFLCRI